MADVMDIEEGGVFDAFVTAGAELQRTQVAPEADAFTFAQIASHEGVASTTEDLSAAEAVELLASLRRRSSTRRGRWDISLEQAARDRRLRNPRRTPQSARLCHQ